MLSFKTAMRGYDKKEVEQYISSITLKSKAGEDTLKEKIGILEEEIVELNSKLELLQGRENKLNIGILRVAELEESAKKRMEQQAALEKERLELFKNKWTEYAVRTARSEYAEEIEVLDSYLAEYTKSVKSIIEEGMSLKPSSPKEKGDDDSEKLASLCRKLGILEE